MQPGLNQIPKGLFGHLLSFVVVAEFMNFRLAAEALGRTQPAITTQIHQLESHLGVALFERTTRSVRLTPAGEHLLDRARKLLAQTQQLITDMRTARFGVPNQIMVSVAPTIASTLIPQTLTRFDKSNPEVRVLISEHLGPEMFDALQNRGVDFGIGPYRRVPPGIAFELLFQQPLYLIVHNSHPLVRRGHAKLTDLADLELLCPAPGTTAREVLDQALLTQGVVVQPRYEALQYQTLFVLASAHQGATVMPVVNPDLLTAMSLVALPFEDFPMQRAIGLLTRDGEPLSDMSQALVAELLDTARQHYHLTDFANAWLDNLPSDTSHERINPILS